MGGKLQWRDNSPAAPRRGNRALNRIRHDVEIEQLQLRGKTKVTEFAMWEVAELKAVQRHLEQQQPEAADVLLLIVAATVSSIANSVELFCEVWER
jgi:hypothetical protein